MRVLQAIPLHRSTKKRERTMGDDWKVVAVQYHSTIRRSDDFYGSKGYREERDRGRRAEEEKRPHKKICETIQTVITFSTQ